MAIQGTQVPMYTKHTLFLYFSDFFQFFLFLYAKQNKAKLEKKKKKKSEKYKNNVCFVYIGNYVPWMAIETKFFKLCISCNLDEHLYA